MLNIVIFGAPGSGKGTQSERIVEKYGINHISTGDVLRAEIKNGTELGKTAKGYIDQGQLIPDELMIDILASVFDSFKDSKGVIFDGFPRTIAQAEALKKMLAERGQDVSVMVDLEVPEDELSCFTKLTVKSSKAAKLFNAVQKAEVSWKRIKPLMKLPEEPDELAVPAPADVTLEDLSFGYTEEPIFAGLDLTAHPGEIIDITGPVACGKSTFGRVFLCEASYGGSARFGGKEFSALTPREIASTVGYLGHDPELSADTVQNNVLCGSKQDPMPWLAAVALKDEVQAMENGVDTVIGPSGTRLSGGQAQRLALARTLAHPRPVLVLDDPFSALDRSTEDTVFANLQEYAKDKVVFLISHRLYHFPQMQRVIFMEDGKTTVGTHEELLAAVPAYRQLYESQTGGQQHENEQ